MNHPRLTHLFCWALCLLALSSSWAIAQEQEQPKPKYNPRGTDIFRWILGEQGLTPLAKIEEIVPEPQKTILIVLGDPASVEGLPLKRFIADGGALLFATDRTTTVAEGLGAHLVGFNIHAKEAAETYHGLDDCIRIHPTTAGEGLFHGLTHVYTNRPGLLYRLKDLPALGRIEVASEEIPLGRIRFDELEDGFVAAGKNLGKGRFLLLSDHSIFINAMLAQEDNDNSRFAANCIRWLADGKRTKALLVDENQVETSFDITLPPMPSPVPPPEVVIQAINQGIHELQQEDRFNGAIDRVLNGMDRDRFLNGWILFLTIALAVYGFLRLTRSRFRAEDNPPALAARLPEVLPSADVVLERERAMLRNENFWEAAHLMARTGLEELLPGAAAGYRLRGSWRQKRRLKKALERLWRIGFDPEPVAVSAEELSRLGRQLEAVKQAYAQGRIEVIS
jgi:hypothetical protein